MSVFKNDWGELLSPEFEKTYFMDLQNYLENEYLSETIFPEKSDVYNALHYTSYENTKVIILGQDPYHRPGQAHGLSFSVQKGVQQPPSLKNIFKELHSDLNIPIPIHGCLESWANQGVLLLNTVLTVREGHPNSHKNIGWEVFTDQIISSLNNRLKPVVFILWGNHSRGKKKLITNDQHHIIEAAHPSPLSAHRGFFGSAPFSKTNQILRSIAETEIDWKI